MNNICFPCWETELHSKSVRRAGTRWCRLKWIVRVPPQIPWLVIVPKTRAEVAITAVARTWGEGRRHPDDRRWAVEVAAVGKRIGQTSPVASPVLTRSQRLLPAEQAGRSEELRVSDLALVSVDAQAARGVTVT